MLVFKFPEKKQGKKNLETDHFSYKKNSYINRVSKSKVRRKNLRTLVKAMN